MDLKAHWEAAYSAKQPGAMSWYRRHLETSLTLIERTNIGSPASIIDVGGGASTLADDLLDRGYQHISVLDISEAALQAARKRLGERAGNVHWMAGDVALVELPEHAFDLWHDRAVFHFLTLKSERSVYIRQATRVLKPGGYLILATFAANGPNRCNCLNVIRYSAESLAREAGEYFRLVESVDELHHTPSGAKQPFVYTLFKAG